MKNGGTLGEFGQILEYICGWSSPLVQVNLIQMLRLAGGLKKKDGHWCNFLIATWIKYCSKLPPRFSVLTSAVRELVGWKKQRLPEMENCRGLLI